MDVIPHGVEEVSYILMNHNLNFTAYQVRYFQAICFLGSVYLFPGMLRFILSVMLDIVSGHAEFDVPNYEVKSIQQRDL